VRRMQVKEFAACMGHAANLNDALLETGLITTEVIAHQLASPVAEEVTRMLACTTRAEVVDHGFQARISSGAISPHIASMGFLFTRCQHLYRRLIGVDDWLSQHRFTQGIDKRLKLHAGLPNPAC